MIKRYYKDIGNATFDYDESEAAGKSFDDGILFCLDKLMAQAEDVTRCKECAHCKVCFMTDALGDDGFCSLGIKEV